jgi:major inositol transporter-like SP family MFS transporter
MSTGYPRRQSTSAASTKFDLPHMGSGRPVHRLGVIATVATFGGLLFGYDTGVVNGALEPLSEDFGLTSFSEGLVVASLMVGAAFGAVFGGRVADAQGRRKTILLLACVFIAGTLGCVLAPGAAFLIGARFVLGITVGGASATVPVYLGEVAPSEKRGSFVTRNELMIVGGQLAAFIINAVIFNFFGHVDSIWRWMLVVALAPAIALLVGMLFQPESPRWLISQGRTEEALAVLKLVRSPERAEAEVAEVTHLAAEDAKESTGGLSDLGTRWVMRLVIIGVGIGFFQQLTGINSVMYYGTQLLTNAGLDSGVAIIGNIANGVFSLAGISLGMYLLNKLPRRVMFLTGYALIALFHTLVALTAVFVPAGPGQAWTVLAFLVLFVFSMQGTVGPLTWLMLSEIFPMKIRSFAMGICVFVLWMMNAVVAQFFPPLIQGMGMTATFGMFAGIAVIAFVFLACLLPETKDKDLAQFERDFKAKYGRK